MCGERGLEVLITGVTGFIGRRLYSLLKNDDISIRGISRKRAGFSGSWTSLDVTDLDKLKKFVREHGFDVIIHLAALTKRRYGNLPAEDYFRVNTLGTENVLKAASEVGAKVVFASTAAVYTPSRHPYVESKRRAEKVCEQYGAVVARIFNAYGEGKEGGVIETFIKRALRGEPLLVNVGQVRDFIYVEDVCRALWLLAKKADPGFYDVGTGKGIRIEDVARLIIAFTGSPSSIEIRPAPTSISIADISSLKSMGFRPEVSFEEGLKLVVNYMRNTF